jgi:ABC-type branched-subunit amino acid transport system ATPase component
VPLEAAVPQLDLHDVSKGFGGVPANDRISLQVHKGEIVGLIGPNGSGKTTLFNSIVGHHVIDGGTVRFEDRDVTGLRVQAIARLGVLRTFQQARIYRDMTCIENVEISLPPRLLLLKDLAWRLPAASTARAIDLLNFVGLTEQSDELAGKLSFGEQRLLELAMVLMNEPKLLLLDEPTAGVNPTTIKALIEHLRQISREFGITLVVIEHNMPVIMGLADRIYCLNRGRMLAEGTPAQIQNDQRVIDAYLGAR